MELYSHDTEFREKTCLLKTTVNFCQWTQCPVDMGVLTLSVFPPRQEQARREAVGVSEDPAAAAPARQELGVLAAHVRPREQQDGQAGNGVGGTAAGRALSWAPAPRASQQPACVCSLFWPRC